LKVGGNLRKRKRVKVAIMSKKSNFQKHLKFHCYYCQTVYQLTEIHSRVSFNCSEDCRTRWQEILHEYYQEKVLGYLKQQEEKAEEEENEDEEN
jgi:hypothetical protein